MSLIVTLALGILGPLAPVKADGGSQSRSLLGWIEWVVLEPQKLRLKARLDTGAKTSSLHAVDVVEFERDGAKWVRFKLPLEAHKEDYQGELPTLVYERPVLDTVLIKRKNAHVQPRYVVEMAFCIDGREHEAEFSLADRGNFNYPVLLGRRFLGSVALVDPRENFLAQRRCKHASLDELETEAHSHTAASDSR
ncbi:MAG: ATP-dependent zinc protease [Nitrococcus mobilis]|nr:ATP-dependent zinc protease [Nitrococcus mobilis]